MTLISSRTKAWSRRLTASAVLPLSGACDQEVSKRTLATLQKVCEEVSKKETRNHFEPRSSGDNVPTSA
jgi:hypothetical protein